MRDRDFTPAQLNEHILDTLQRFENHLSQLTGEKLVLIAYRRNEASGIGNSEITMTAEAGGDRPHFEAYKKRLAADRR